MCNWKSAPHCLGKVNTLLSGAVRLFAMLSVIAGTTVVSGAEVVTKETDMQAIFFLDKHAVAQAVDMKHRFFQPERVDGFIELDKTGGSVAYFNVYYDPRDKEAVLEPHLASSRMPTFMGVTGGSITLLGVFFFYLGLRRLR